MIGISWPDADAFGGLTVPVARAVAKSGGGDVGSTVDFAVDGSDARTGVWLNPCARSGAGEGGVGWTVREDVGVGVVRMKFSCVYVHVGAFVCLCLIRGTIIC